MDETLSPLSQVDHGRLQAYEVVMTEGLTTFLAVGKALLAIRDEQLSPLLLILRRNR